MTINKTSLDIDNKKISLNIRAGDKGDILFIHGLGCSKESFDNVLKSDRFQGWRLIAPDLLGFGESSKPDDYLYCIEDHAKSLQILLSLLDSENPVIVSHSMGGAIGLLLTDIIPSIEHYFSLEGNLIGEDCKVSKEAASETEGNFILQRFNKHPLRYRCRGTRSEPPPGPMAFHRSATSLVKLSESGKLLDKYKELTCPKTYIYGDKNRETKIIDVLAGEDTVEIKDSGHFMMNDNPDQTYSEIEKRLAPVL